MIGEKRGRGYFEPHILSIHRFDLCGKFVIWLKGFGEEIYSGKAILCLPPSPLSVFLLLSGTTLQDKRTEAESRKYPFSLPIPSSPPM